MVEVEPPADLTPRQWEFLSTIARYLESGSSPTYRELCEELGMKSPTAATQKVEALDKKGYLTGYQRQARSLVLTNKAKRALWPPTVNVVEGRVVVRAAYPLTPDEATALANEILNAAGHAGAWGESDAC